MFGKTVFKNSFKHGYNTTTSTSTEWASYRPQTFSGTNRYAYVGIFVSVGQRSESMLQNISRTKNSTEMEQIFKPLENEQYAFYKTSHTERSVYTI